MLCPTIQKEKISEALQEYSKLKKTSKNKWIMVYVVYFNFFIFNNLANGTNGILRDNLKNFGTGQTGFGTTQKFSGRDKRDSGQEKVCPADL